MIKIVSKKIFNDMQIEIEELNREIDIEIARRNQFLKIKDEEKEDLQKIIQLKEKEIKRLNEKIKIDKDNYIQEITLKNQLIEDLIKEKEQCKIKIHTLTGAKGGYTKEINKLNDKLDAKDRVIEEYKLALNELKNKNQLQSEKIQELIKTKEHTIEEYKNNGLRKNMKKKRGN